MAQPDQSSNTLILNRKMKAIEDFGRRYVIDLLDEDRRQLSNIMSKPLDALTFFYGKAFMRGRNDDMSVIFMKRSLKVLREYTSLLGIDLASLEQELLLHEVNNHHDRRMVLESIRFIRENLKDYGYNIFKWAVDAIQTNRSLEAFRTLDGIHAIGDKLAAFYLRNVALVSDLEPIIQQESYIYFQPIDTWVKQVTDAIGITEKETDRDVLVVKKRIITCCCEAEVSPLLFNAGAWMMGAHAFEMLIERL